jgi:hypothetical protein
VSRVDVFPVTPEIEPCYYRAQSAPVLIRTVSGEWYTARWTVYADDEFPPVWELIGRDGLQLDREEVVAWFNCAVVAELVGAATRLANNDFTMTTGTVWADASVVRSALANIGGAP